MLIVTTPSIEGKKIKEHRGIVFGEIMQVPFFLKSFTASIKAFTGERAGEYEQEVTSARADALKEMMERATKVGANAVVGVRIDYETFAQGIFMVSASGTAVVIEE